MKAEKISLIIASICKEKGIEYCSTNPHYITLVEDAVKLGKLYLELRIMAGDIQEILDRHNITGLEQLLYDDLKALENTEHDLLKLAQKLKDENVD
jgi:hypothetical protein